MPGICLFPSPDPSPEPPCSPPASPSSPGPSSPTAMSASSSRFAQHAGRASTPASTAPSSSSSACFSPLWRWSDEMSLTPVPPGHVGTVVTYLEMTERPPLRPLPASPLRLERWREPEPARYRLLFERVGARWLWYSRLAMDDER